MLGERPGMRKGQRVVEYSRPRETEITPSHLVAIILFVTACVNKIMELGRRFPWSRPDRCPWCGGVRLWGHGVRAGLF
ncbi:hypothetical protein DFAR_710022 [Desulfarculales bacterium]